ncbi:MAG: histone deacetylase family protein [Caldilineaceae bacterium]|nr:histone deacetylase family protein [Caldilineaceae bacterium]
MLVIYSDLHQFHNPPYEFLERGLVPYTESPARAEAILAEIKAAGIGPIVAPDDFGLEPIRAIHSQAYLDHLQTIYDQWVAVGGTPVAAMPFAFPRPGLDRSSPTPFATTGRYAFDLSAPITATSWAAILSSAYCALTGAERIARGEDFAYALCRPPGHHASRELAGGYCFLNNAAIAAHFLTAGGEKKVAILDIDVHHGNGTQSIFYERDDVLFISIHGAPEWEYPYFSGFADERGSGVGEGYTLNFPLEQAVSDAQYLHTVDETLAAVKAFDPAYLVLSAGFDAFDGDPLGQFRLSTEGFGAIGQRVARLTLPTLIVQEGGYAIHALGRNVVSLLKGFAMGRAHDQHSAK